MDAEIGEEHSVSNAMPGKISDNLQPRSSRTRYEKFIDMVFHTWAWGTWRFQSGYTIRPLPGTDHTNLCGYSLCLMAHVHFWIVFVPQ